MPIKRFLQKISIKKRSLPGTVASLLTIVVLVVVFLGLLTMFIPLIVQEIQIISALSPTDIMTNLSAPIQQLEVWAQKLQIKELENSSIQAYVTGKLTGVLSFSWITNTLNGIVSAVGAFFVFVFTIAFMAFYFLNEENLLNTFFKKIAPVSWDSRIDSVIKETRQILSKYLLGLLAENFLVFALLLLLLSLFGIKNAVLLAFLGAVLNIIPYIGPLIASLLGCVIAISTHAYTDFYSEWYWIVVKVAGIFGAVQFIDNMFIQPYIFSTSVNAHPLEIFIILLAIGSIAGIGGMILAVPVYTVIRIIVAEVYTTLKST